MNPAGLPLLLTTLLAGFVAGLALMIGFASTNRKMIYVTLRGTAVWGLAYGALLLTTSLSSEDQLLGHGQRKAFCGFYLDCHVGVTVLRTDRAHQLFLGDSSVVADGEFVLVDLRVDNDAQRMPLGPRHIRAYAEDVSGQRFKRRHDLEFEIAELVHPVSVEDAPIPARGSVRRLMVFEVPEGTGALRMHVSSGGTMERLLELLLIGDEDSLLHGRSYFRI